MSPFHFVTEVSKRGYDIVDATISGNRVPVVTDCIKPGHRYRARRIFPLDFTGMYTDFAKVRTNDEIIAFANRFGLLGIGQDEGEAVSLWNTQSEYLAALIDLHRSGKMTRHANVVSVLNDFLDGVRTEFIRTPQGLRMCFVPKTLLAAIWLQFALSIDAKTRWKRCKNCRAWMEISLSPTGRSPRAKYCGDACKHGAFRARQRAARHCQ